jgi:putative transposase
MPIGWVAGNARVPRKPVSHFPVTAGLLQMRIALGRRYPTAGLLQYVDRGWHYASQASQDMPADNGIVCRMRNKGECLDNAMAQRCFGSGKRAWTAHQHDATRQEARDDLSAAVEMFSKSRRQHSYFG